MDAEPLREVLSAWLRLQDLSSLQQDCNEKLKQKLEAVRRALDDEYSVDFELLTTGTLAEAAQADLKAFAERLEESDDFAAHLHLIDTEVLQTRLAEAEAQELPRLEHTVELDSSRTLSTEVGGAQTVITVLSLKECLKLPGITDGRLFRKNVRQALGAGNKVNRALRGTINGERVRDFFFYHNGITALCDSMKLNDDKTKLTIKGLSVVNGCTRLPRTCAVRPLRLPAVSGITPERRETPDRSSCVLPSRSILLRALDSSPRRPGVRFVRAS